MTLTAVYQKDPESGWYTAQIKEIPQAISQGETLEEARENLKDALETVFRFLADETETAPGGAPEPTPARAGGRSGELADQREGEREPDHWQPERPVTVNATLFGTTHAVGVLGVGAGVAEVNALNTGQLSFFLLYGMQTI